MKHLTTNTDKSPLWRQIVESVLEVIVFYLAVLILWLLLKPRG